MPWFDVTSLRILRITETHYAVLLEGNDGHDHYHDIWAEANRFFSLENVFAAVRESYEAGRIPIANYNSATAHTTGTRGHCSVGCQQYIISGPYALRGPQPFSEAYLIAQGIHALPEDLPSSLIALKPPSENPEDNIVSFGVELEAACTEDTRSIFEDMARFIPRMEVHGDGSIRTSETYSDSLEACFWTTSYTEFEAWLKWSYAQTIRPNSSCGFHVHVRPINSKIGMFSTKHYWDGFHKAYRSFAETKAPKYSARINNEYCKVVAWDFNRQARQSDRYQAINTLSLQRHGIGAVEHRILPYQETPHEALSSVKWLLGTAADLIKPDKLELYSRTMDLSKSDQLLTRWLEEGVKGNADQFGQIRTPHGTVHLFAEEESNDV